VIGRVSLLSDSIAEHEETVDPFEQGFLRLFQGDTNYSLESLTEEPGNLHRIIPRIVQQNFYDVAFFRTGILLEHAFDS
jgi:hypothetical protein